jgi:hypothetical protein
VIGVGMKLTSPKTYTIIRKILEKKQFTQTELSNELDISWGQINKTTNWLLKKKYIIKKKKYELWDPLGILNSIIMFRRLEPLYSLTVRIDEENVLKTLNEETDVILARVTALNYYSQYFRENIIDFYARDAREVKDLLSKVPGEGVVVNVYKEDLNVRDDIKIIENFKVTSEIRTVIDLFCSERAYTAHDLIKEIWGIEIEV